MYSNPDVMLERVRMILSPLTLVIKVYASNATWYERPRLVWFLWNLGLNSRYSYSGSYVVVQHVKMKRTSQNACPETSDELLCVCVCVCARARACACARARFHESPGTCNGKRIRCVFLTSPWLHYKLIFGNSKTPCRPPVTQFKALIVVGYFRDELCGIKTSHVAEAWDLVREMCYQLKGFPYLKTVRFDYYRNPLRTKPTWRVKLFVILF